MSVSIRRLAPGDTAAERLLEQSDRCMQALYPPESNHLESLEALADSNAGIFGLFVGDELVACGAVKILANDGRYGEIKRVFVDERHRGQGHAVRIMTHIEAHLRAEGISVARLETGIRQPDALALYAKLGYRRRGAYGEYAADPLSVFMEKTLY